jgi:hypothetical protein
MIRLFPKQYRIDPDWSKTLNAEDHPPQAPGNTLAGNSNDLLSEKCAGKCLFSMKLLAAEQRGINMVTNYSLVASDVPIPLPLPYP